MKQSKFLRPKLRLRRLSLCLLFLPFWTCAYLDSLYDLLEVKKEFDPCDASYSIYEDKKHFFHEDFLEEDAGIKQRKWWKEAFLMHESPCDPLKDKED